MGGRFEGKVALVTGGASGIGAATVDAFISAGARVMIADVSPGTQGENCSAIHADISNPADCKAAVDAAIDRFGRLDIVVNSAGVGELVPSEAVAPEQWRRTQSINLDGTFFMCQAAIRHMLDAGGGVIVNVASIHGHVGFGAHAAYTASKGGVVNLTRSLGIEYASRNIRINAVCPGFVWTPMIEVGVSDELMPKVVALHPIGRIGRADEIAAPILFLASDEASFMAGASLTVDGGYTAQ